MAAQIREIVDKCHTGYDGGAYATRFQYNKFPDWLRSAAERMINQYNADPRKIWSVKQADINLIYGRLREFDGIGDALAKMGLNILVRNHGVAGGKKSKHLLAVKPDVLLRRVMYRTGIAPSEKEEDVETSVKALKLRSAADFDASAWIIGNEYCFRTKPMCPRCPINRVCRTGQSRSIRGRRLGA